MSLVDAAGLVGAFALVYMARLIAIHKAAVRDMQLPPDHYLSWARVSPRVQAADSLSVVLAESRPGVEQATVGGEVRRDWRDHDNGEGHGQGDSGGADSEAGIGQVRGRASAQHEARSLADHHAERLTWGALLGAGADALLANLDNINHLLNIDWNVLQALDFSYAADLSDFDRLQAVVHEGLNQAPDQVAGFLSRLQGYVAEQMAADVLRSQGHHVEFPESSNQPGYDLLVDGNPVQIKAGLDPQAIRDHLHAHPDIPVYTSPEMAAHFQGVPQVHVLPELDHNVLHDTTVETLHSVNAIHAGFGSADGIGDPGHPDRLDHVGHLAGTGDATAGDTLSGSGAAVDIGAGGAETGADGGLLHQLSHLGAVDIAGIHVHIPLITAAISGWREINLLADRLTDFPTALKNMGLDMLGTGAGGAVGAKIGAALGSFAGPVGFVLGGLIGGIAGAMTGRSLTNSVKLAPLRAAHERFTATVNTARATIARAQEETRQQMELAASEARHRVESGVAEIRASCQRELETQRAAVLSAMQAFSESFPDILRRVRVALVVQREEVLAQLPPSSWFTRYVWPTRAGLSYLRVSRWFHRRLQFVDSVIADFEALASAPAAASEPSGAEGAVSPVTKVARIRQFVLDHPAVYEGLDEAASALASTWDSSLRQARDTVRTSQERAAALEREAKQWLHTRVLALNDALARLIKGQADAVNSAWETVRQEAGKLGQRLPPLAQQR